MDDKSLYSQNVSPNSTKELDFMECVRRARIEKAEKTGISADLRAAERSHLERLNNQLRPILEQLPRDADVFNHGVVPGERPRFYVDMISFVEMGRDRRTFRFLMDSKTGRQLLGESEDISVMAGAVTQYLAKRLVEREGELERAIWFEPIETNEATKPLELGISSPITAMPVITEIHRPYRFRIFLAFLIGIVAGIAAIYIGSHWDGFVSSEIIRSLFS